MVYIVFAKHFKLNFFSHMTYYSVIGKVNLIILLCVNRVKYFQYY